MADTSKRGAFKPPNESDCPYTILWNVGADNVAAEPDIGFSPRNPDSSSLMPCDYAHINGFTAESEEAVTGAMGRRKGPPLAWGLVLTAWLTAAPSLPAMQTGGARVIVIDGQPSVSLKSLARTYGLQLQERGLTLSGAGATLRFSADSRKAWHNGDLVWLQRPLRKAGRGWAVSEPDWRTFVDPAVQPGTHVRPGPVRLVVLDPGHGGEDRGTLGARSSVEKEFTLDVCRRAAQRLERGGLRVLLTRDADVAMDLEERAAFAARNRADVFVSVHFNSAGNPDASGIETFILPAATEVSTSDWGKPAARRSEHPGNGFDGANAVLGQALHHELLQSAKTEDRGLRRARFVVLNAAACPAVLVECGFLSNADEEHRIASPAYRDSLAAGIADGVFRYAGVARRAPNDDR